jgi:SNF2 family DNA or RNA helicase
MLMSLKSGGVGLNLVRGNQVISLDLAWSHAVESQAFDRVHRIGQVKDVFVNRLTIKDTVEQRIRELQDRKQDMADGSLGEGSGRKLGKLTVSQLAGLFGLNASGQRV